MIDGLGQAPGVIQPKVGHVGKCFVPADQQLLVSPWFMVIFTK
jgi:hypothetical protein